MKCDVIVTYCWNRVGYTILKSLNNMGLKVWVADTSKNNICSLSKYKSGAFSYPDPFTDETKFIEFLKTKVLELKPKVLLPTHDESIIIMRHRHEFPDDLIIPYEDEAKLLTLSNKEYSTKLAADAGVPIPIVYENIDEITDFPVVLKSVIGNSAKDVYFPASKEDLIKLVEENKDKTLLIQEFIGGCDYSVDCIRWDNYWNASVYRAIITKTNGGGTTTQREIVDMPILEKYAKQFLDSINFKGVCGLDFRVDDKTNKVAYIETNARFTGGIATPVAAGFDIPNILYTLATTGKFEPKVKAKVGIKTKWILGDIITLVGRSLKFNFNSKEISQVLKFKGFDAFDDFDKKDKKAFWGEMQYYLSKLIKNGKLNP